MDGKNIVDRFFAKREAAKGSKRYYVTFKATLVKLGVVDIEAKSESEAKKLVDEAVKSGTVQWKAEELDGIEFLQIADLSKAHDGMTSVEKEPAGSPEVPPPAI